MEGGAVPPPSSSYIFQSSKEKNITFRRREAESKEGKGETNDAKGKNEKKNQNTASDNERNDVKGKKISEVRL